MAQADYIKGTCVGHKELLNIIIGWATGDNEGVPHNSRAIWTKVMDYVDDSTDPGLSMNQDGERYVILKSVITGELPIYIGLRTFSGYEGKNQQGIQINAYTNFDPDLPWDCQAGSLADPDMYNVNSHFYEGCPAILVGAETICYWLNIDAKRITCLVRTPTVPQEDDYKKIRQSVVYEMFYLGWLKRIVSKEGYPYPMSVSGTTYTLGNASVGYVQRNFAYNNVLGSLRHLPPFYWDYMNYDGLQSLVYSYETGTSNNRTLRIGVRWPMEKRLDNNTEICGSSSTDLNTLKNLPISGVSNPICGPSNSDVSCPFTIPCIAYNNSSQAKTKEAYPNTETIFTYDTINMANRILYFDGLWGWQTTYPVRNSFVRSLCLCTIKVNDCGSYNYLSNVGEPPPLSASDSGLQHDQVAAHKGWLPGKVVESLSGKRLLVPVYVGCVGSIMEMQSHTRLEFGMESYDDEQYRIQVAGVMDGLCLVPGLGLSAQDSLKIDEGGNKIEYIVVHDVYRKGPFDYCAMLLGATEWHEENPGIDTPVDTGV